MFSAGTRLGSYEILSPLGVGGMGEVYRASDLKLKRDVAIKVLPEAFARDADRISRLQREAEVLASLNHPNIAAIHQLDEFQGASFLVLELVEGPTLADVIARSRGSESGSFVKATAPSLGEARQAAGVGPRGIPIDEALKVARQIADAFQAAHDKGVIHRDLKPANVKITPADVVKVLDFGLAKIYEPQPGDMNFSNSPTVAGQTQPNVIMGTAAYMSPEQARGRVVDRASDIWAFGCVLYEMLAGTPAFSGETVTDILGGIVRVDPDWSVLPEATPLAIRSLLRRCLQKDSKRRLKDIADARIEIEEVLAEAGKPAVVPAKPVTAAPRNRERLAWTLAGIFLLVGIVSVPFVVAYLREPVAENRAIRFVMLAPERATVLLTPPAISPDGRRVAFIANLEGKTQVWIRPLESVTAQPLAGTDGADFPFWSPDSRFIAFFAGGKLKKIDASGGPPQTLCDASSGRGGTWNRDGVIVFAPTQQTAPLHRVSSSGGPSTPITTLDPSGGEVNHRGAAFLPDGRHFLFFVLGGEKQGIYVGSLDTKDRQLLLSAASAGVYASPGYVLFVKERSLMAQRLDTKNLQLSGEAFPVAEPVGISPASLVLGTFSVSDTGVLVYGSGGGADRQLTWFDRVGKLVERIGPSMSLLDIALASDQKRAAIQGPLFPNQDILVVDLVRGVPSRLTFDPAVEDYPVWAPDGSQILFSSMRNGVEDLYRKVSSGAGNEEVLLKSSTPKIPSDWSRDGRFILYENVDPKNRNDIWVLPLSGDRKPQVFLQTPFAEQMARFSPDGKWVAYVSDESTRQEVYVRSFPPSGGKWQVSTNGGSTPRWRRDGKELFYLASDSRIMSVDVKAGAASFEVSSPKALFEAPVDTPAGANRYDVSPDGQRFLVNAPAENTSSASMTVVVNWLANAKNER